MPNFDPSPGNRLFLIVAAGGPVLRTIDRIKAEQANGFEVRVIATPVTLNTLTKWADGHSDNLALGLLCEAMGARIPIVAELSLSQEFANHPAVPPAIERLTAAGVEIQRLAGPPRPSN